MQNKHLTKCQAHSRLKKKSLSKLKADGNTLNSIKDVYKKPTATTRLTVNRCSLPLKTSPLCSTLSVGPGQCDNKTKATKFRKK